ncbi:MAG TPA: hypothetical protein VN040_28115 [Pseudosphingobacterium sp.]|nr:hypothetical protein [Pseudosphingobacterium sp.]
MFFGIFIFTRLLLVASMVFIVGYVFGSFAKNKSLTIITKVATVLIIVIPILTGVFFVSSGGRFHRGDHHVKDTCHFQHPDSTMRNK